MLKELTFESPSGKGQAHFVVVTGGVAISSVGRPRTICITPDQVEELRHWCALYLQINKPTERLEP